MAETARRGRGRPAIGPVVVTRVDPQRYAELERRAGARGRPVSELLREAIAQYLAVPDAHPVQDPLITEDQAA